MFAGKPVCPPCIPADDGLEGIRKEGSLGSAWNGMSLLTCEPSRPHVLTSHRKHGTAARSPEDGGKGCSRGSPGRAGQQ